MLNLIETKENVKQNEKSEVYVTNKINKIKPQGKNPMKWR